MNTFRIKFVNAVLLLASIGVFSQDSKTGSLEDEFSTAVKRKDYSAATSAAFKLGQIFLDQKDNDRALDWFSNVTRYAGQAKDAQKQIQGYSKIGAIRFEQKSYRKASDAFSKAADLAKSSKDTHQQALSTFNVGLCLEADSRQKRSVDLFEQTLKLATTLQDEPLQSLCISKLLAVHQQLGDTEQANYYQNLKRQLSEAKKNVVTTDAQVGELQKEIKRAESEIVLKNTMIEEGQNKLLQAEDSLRQVGAIVREKQLQVELLSKEKELADLKIHEQEAELKNERLLIYLVITGVALSVIIIIITVMSYRNQLNANKQIQKQAENIKGSIRYAGRIQEAMLPNKQTLTDFFPESFVLFQPRDTVSGDFYWFNEIRNGEDSSDIALAAVDCTGHGVPGAFMSMIGMNSLNGIIARGIKNSDNILSTLHHEIRTNLKQPETGNNDGMDVALCIFHRDRNTIEFSGAKNPIIYIQDNQLTQVKGDIHAIGGSKSKPEISFRKHEIPLDRTTMIYLFSDGYRDQFGGQDNTKFMSKNFQKLLLRINEMPMEKQKEMLTKTLEDWRGDRTQTDDVMVIGIRVSPQNEIMINSLSEEVLPSAVNF